MFAVIAQGGKQYRVEPGDRLRIERITSLTEPVGQEIELEDVRAIGEGSDITLGAPRVENAIVKARIVREFRDRKVLVYRKKKRKMYRKRRGHRQGLFEIFILDVSRG